jgi:hypothetical protein
MFFGVQSGGSSLLDSQIPNPPPSRHFFESQKSRNARVTNSRSSRRSNHTSFSFHKRPSTSTTKATIRNRTSLGVRTTRNPARIPSQIGTNRSSIGVTAAHTTPRTSLGRRRQISLPSGRKSAFRSAEVECSIALAETNSLEHRKSQYQRPMTTFANYANAAHAAPISAVTSNAELMEDYLSIIENETPATVLPLPSGTVVSHGTISDALINSAFNVLVRMKDRMGNPVEKKILNKISNIFQKAIFSQQVMDTRTSTVDHVFIPNDLTNNQSTEKNNDDDVKEDSQEDSEEENKVDLTLQKEKHQHLIQIATKPAVKTMVGKVVRINTLGVDRQKVPTSARLHGALGVIETAVPFLPESNESNESTESNDSTDSTDSTATTEQHWLCGVRLASGDTVKVSSARLEIIQEARGPVVVAPLKENHLNHALVVAKPGTKGLPHFEVVKRLSKRLQHLEKKEESFEGRLEKHRNARTGLRQEVDSLYRKVNIGKEELLKEQNVHKETRALSEKRRLACVKLRNQGVGLVRANNSLESRKLLNERHLKHELKVTRHQLAETRLSLAQSQSALTTLQRQLIVEMHRHEGKTSQTSTTLCMFLCFGSKLTCCVCVFFFLALCRLPCSNVSLRIRKRK